MSAQTHPISSSLTAAVPNTYAETWQSVEVDAPPETTYEAVLTTDLSDFPPVRFLAWIRGIPDRVIRKLRGLAPPPTADEGTLRGLVEAGWWIELPREAPKEISLGLVMWDRRVEEGGMTRAMFDSPGPGAVWVGWGFVVAPLEGGRSLLVTQTRSQPVDAGARRKFARYWFFNKPFAGLTRRMVLTQMRRRPEALAASESPSARPRPRPI